MIRPSPGRSTETKFLTGWRLAAFRTRFVFHCLEYVLQRRNYPLFRLGLMNDGLAKTFKLGHDIGLRKVVQIDDRFFLALTSPHYPSRAYDRMIAHGGMNIASAGTRDNQQISTAILAITRECRLHCQHCYEQFNLGTPEAIPIARWREVIRDLQRMGTSVIVLSGGEPVLRFDGLLELLRSGDKGLSDFHLHTSGQGVTYERALRLKEAGLSAAAVGLDDFDADRHDTLRGVKGSHKEAVSALQTFNQAGILTYVNMCATKELVRSGGLWKYLDLAKSLNVGFIQLLEPRPCGGYMTNAHEVLLTKSDRGAVMDFFQEANSSRRFRDYPIVYYVAYAESPERAGCMMGGLSHFHIDAIGNVNPCVFLPVTFGNILHEDFETIYRRMRKAIPRPLHKECPSLELAERLQNCYRERGSMPVPYEMVQGDWGGDVLIRFLAVEATRWNPPISLPWLLQQLDAILAIRRDPMKRSGLLAFCPVLSCLLAIVLAQAGETAADTTRNPTSTELLPIISYDPDAGFGYGVKVFALGHLGFDESFDLILFNSTKGERWYRLVVSLPDFERRQGAVYPLAIDLTIDYDKWIANSFFGIGNGSTYDNQETYTREPFEISLILSRAFSPFVICQGGMKYNTIRNFNFSAESRLANLQPALNGSRVSFASLYAALRYDTRNSYINPSCGLVALGECEIAPHADLNDVGFTRIAAWLQSYSLLSSDRIVFANRLGIQGLVGQNLPVQVLLPIGGNNTLRGTPQDRFLGKVGSVANSEIRFPIYWRFGGVVGFDAGKVWNKFSELDLARWATNPVAGLRFYMDTFVVRADVGFGSETTGFYLNFGHVF